jgi:AcrR family transcriptional regulator
MPIRSSTRTQRTNASATKRATRAKSVRRPRTEAPRPRNATATREAILESARRAFVRAGYDGVGVREIAAGAGVTAMLVNRYFGSKEQLFAEVVAQTMAAPIILTAAVLESPAPGEAIAAALVGLTSTVAAPLDGFLIMHRSGSSERAAEIAREQIQLHHQKTMTSALAGPAAAQRAAIVLSIVAGVQIMRQMIGLSALTDAKPTSLVKLLGPLFEQLINAGKP